MEHLAKILKQYGLRKMVFGFAMFSSLGLLLYSTKLSPEAFSTTAMALIGGMFVGNAAEHLAKKKGDK